jgi:hypothetical protein
MIAFHRGQRSKRANMSDRALIPAPDVIVANGNSFTRYRAAFTSLQIFERAADGRRIEIDDDGHHTIFDLSADQAKHLSNLLVPIMRPK